MATPARWLRRRRAPVEETRAAQEERRATQLRRELARIYPPGSLLPAVVSSRFRDAIEGRIPTKQAIREARLAKAASLKQEYRDAQRFLETGIGWWPRRNLTERGMRNAIALANRIHELAQPDHPDRRRLQEKIERLWGRSHPTAVMEIERKVLHGQLTIGKALYRLDMMDRKLREKESAGDYKTAKGVLARAGLGWYARTNPTKAGKRAAIALASELVGKENVPGATFLRPILPGKPLALTPAQYDPTVAREERRLLSMRSGDLLPIIQANPYPVGQRVAQLIRNYKRPFGWNEARWEEALRKRAISELALNYSRAFGDEQIGSLKRAALRVIAEKRPQITPEEWQAALAPPPPAAAAAAAAAAVPPPIAEPERRPRRERPAPPPERAPPAPPPERALEPVEVEAAPVAAWERIEPGKVRVAAEPAREPGKTRAFDQRRENQIVRRVYQIVGEAIRRAPQEREAIKNLHMDWLLRRITDERFQDRVREMVEGAGARAPAAREGGGGRARPRITGAQENIAGLKSLARQLMGGATVEGKRRLALALEAAENGNPDAARALRTIIEDVRREMKPQRAEPAAPEKATPAEWAEGMRQRSEAEARETPAARPHDLHLFGRIERILSRDEAAGTPLFHMLWRATGSEPGPRRGRPTLEQVNAAVRAEEARLFRGTVGAAGPPAVPPRGARRERALPGVPVKAEARPDEIPQAGTTAGRGRVARTSAEIERERRKKG